MDTTLAPPRVTVSVIIPVYAGEAYLKELVAQLRAVKEQWDAEARTLQLVEAIFVDDAAIDGSSGVLAELTQGEPWLRVIHLSRNFGQHPATIAGVLHSAGDWIATIDEDLQHEPKHIARLVELAANRTADVVYAKPESGVHGSLLRDWGSRGYKRFLGGLTGNKYIQEINSFRVMRGSVARAAASVCSHDTYFDIALGWFTNRICSLMLPLKDRRFLETGKSGYSLRKLISHARRMMVSSQNKVLRAGALLGVLAMLFSVGLGGVVFIQFVFWPETIVIRGWTSLFLSIVFFGGLTVFLLGIALEFLVNVLLHTQGKPVFFTVDRATDALILADAERASAR